MAAGFEMATTEEVGSFNKLNIEQKANFIKEKGWLELDSHSIVAKFRISCFMNGKLESEHEYFEMLLRLSPDGPNLPFAAIYIYYDNGVKMRAGEYSREQGEHTKIYDLFINEPIEFSFEKHPGFKLGYRVILEDVKYGQIFEL